jgi:hypothetical protein
LSMDPFARLFHFINLRQPRKFMEGCLAIKVQFLFKIKALYSSFVAIIHLLSNGKEQGHSWN